MPIEVLVVLVFLPHQDDEFPIQHLIADHATSEAGIQVYYLTASINPGSSLIRNNESKEVLVRLGVKPDNIFFVGDECFFADGSLVSNLPALGSWLFKLLSDTQPSLILVPAWEGGHPDHDCLHAVTAIVCAHLDCLERVKQFPLYHAERCAWKFFRVISPLQANGPVSRFPVPWKRRLGILSNCLSFRSQWRTWLGLFPFVSFHYLFRGDEYLQHVRLNRLTERPHAGPLYYERRGWSAFDTVKKHIDATYDSVESLEPQGVTSKQQRNRELSRH